MGFYSHSGSARPQPTRPMPALPRRTTPCAPARTARAATSQPRAASHSCSARSPAFGGALPVFTDAPSCDRHTHPHAFPELLTLQVITSRHEAQHTGTSTTQPCATQAVRRQTPGVFQDTIRSDERAGRVRKASGPPKCPADFRRAPTCRHPVEVGVVSGRGGARWEGAKEPGHLRREPQSLCVLAHSDDPDSS